MAAVRLTRRERKSLAEITRHQRREARKYPRAMLLLAASGDLISSIARWKHTEAHPFRWTYRGLPLVS